MSAEQRGELVAQAMAWRDRTKPAVLAASVRPLTVAPALAEGAGTPGEVAGTPSRPTGERLGLSGDVRGRMSDPQTRLVEHLDAGAELIRNGAAGQWAAYLPGGEVEAVAAQTVKALLRAGVLKTTP